ncbi:holo-ACP synthase [Fuchsiella alkaliacetigena]|uniref:holo-ACP synthase n=1 Tax=Fuchsiella alkaliacetigena TaxID=957042 RepID=UPI00200A7496|nr:holo-ACP synthase [Fuchsiella alkaliacetigena]MCK8824119.1 holo-ACP synthase [Fuchsiella alkaliacetigena]
MIKGIGVDIIEVQRIKEALAKREKRFQRRIFTAQEIDYCLTQGQPELSFAARFAAKEAVLKALGTGLRDLAWTDIEVVKDSLGKPEIKFSEQGLVKVDSLQIKEVLISLSHTKEYAVAQAVALAGEED